MYSPVNRNVFEVSRLFNNPFRNPVTFRVENSGNHRSPASVGVRNDNFETNVTSELESATAEGTRPDPKGEEIEMSAMDVVDYQIYGDDMQFVQVELDPGEAAIA